MPKYRIYMSEISDLPEGWFCGTGQRCNEQYCRTNQKEEADVFESDYHALLTVKDFNELGYPCNVVPKISVERVFEILNIAEESDEWDE